MAIKKSRIHLIREKTLCDVRHCRFKLCNMVISVPITGAWPKAVGYDIAAPIRIYATPNAVTLMSLEPPEETEEEPTTPPPQSPADDLDMLYARKQ